MVLYLYNITCDASVMDKTAYLNANPIVIDAEYKNLTPQDLLNPTLIVNNNITLYTFNYVYNATDNTYYFVSRVIILSNNLYELRLEKDVLFSNMTKIKNSYAQITRSFTNGLKSIVDTTDTFTDIETISFLSLSGSKVSEFNNDGSDFLLVYYDGRMGDTANYPESDSYVQFTDLYDDGIQPNLHAVNYRYGYGNNTNYRVLNYIQLYLLARRIGNDSQLLSMIKGVYKIPMTTSSFSELVFRTTTLEYTKINLGTTQIDLDYDAGQTKLRAPYSFRSRWVFEDLLIYSGDFANDYFNHNPYSKYEIWCPFVGWVEIASSQLLNKAIKIFYTFNLENGESTCNFYDTASQTIFMTKTANAFLQISLSAINMRELEERKTALTLNTILGTMSSAVAIAGGAYSGNAVAVAGGVISAGKVASNAVTGFTQLHPSGSVNLQNTNSAFQAKLDFVLKRTYKNVIQSNKQRFGYPCNRYALISSESGYFEANSLILSDASGMYKDEIEKIKMLLSQGVFAS